MDSAHSSLQDRGRSRDTRPCCVQVEICRPTVTGMEVQGDGTVAKKRERPKQTEAGAGWELFTQSAGGIPQHWRHPSALPPRLSIWKRLSQRTS